MALGHGVTGAAWRRRRHGGPWASLPLEQYVDMRGDLAGDLPAIYEDVEPPLLARTNDGVTVKLDRLLPAAEAIAL